jgi:hypothetical protein
MGEVAILMGAAQAALTLNQADQQAKSMRAQADYMKSMGEVNSMFANMQASDAIARGEAQARQIGQRKKQVIGAQRASLAGQGIEVDSGTALELQQDTATLSKLDEAQIRNNAWREAWGYKVDSANATAQGKMAQVGIRQQAQSSLMTGGIQAATQMYGGISQYRGPQTPKTSSKATVKT